MIYHPLEAIDNLDEYKFPDFSYDRNNVIDYGRKLIQKYGDYALMGGIGGGMHELMHYLLEELA